MAEDRIQYVDGKTPNRWFTLLVNMAEDDLDPYQYRVLGHYTRWMSINPQGYRRGVQKTADACKMSVAKFKKARQELADMGYLVLEPGPKKTSPLTVKVVDRMAENVTRYIKSDIAGNDYGKSDIAEKANYGKSDIATMSNLTYIEEQQEESKQEEKDSQPAAAPDDKLIGEIIKAWVDGQPGEPVGNPYANKTNRADAIKLIEQGITPAIVAEYMETIANDSWWRGKRMAFRTMAQNVTVFANPTRDVLGEGRGFQSGPVGSQKKYEEIPFDHTTAPPRDKSKAQSLARDPNVIPFASDPNPEGNPRNPS